MVLDAMTSVATIYKNHPKVIDVVPSCSLLYNGFNNRQEAKSDFSTFRYLLMIYLRWSAYTSVDVMIDKYMDIEDEVQTLVANNRTLSGNCLNFRAENGGDIPDRSGDIAIFSINLEADKFIP